MNTKKLTIVGVLIVLIGGRCYSAAPKMEQEESLFFNQMLIWDEMHAKIETCKQAIRTGDYSTLTKTVTHLKESAFSEKLIQETLNQCETILDLAILAGRIDMIWFLTEAGVTKTRFGEKILKKVYQKEENERDAYELPLETILKRIHQEN